MTKQGWIVVGFTVVAGLLPTVVCASTVASAFADQLPVANAPKLTNLNFKQVAANAVNPDHKSVVSHIPSIPDVNVVS